jgi:hypothetical protein
MHREKWRRNSSRRFIGWNSDPLFDYQKPEPITENICVHLRHLWEKYKCPAEYAEYTEEEG